MNLTDPPTDDLKRLQDHFQKYRSDPLAFAYEQCDVRALWSQVAKIIEAIADPAVKFVAVPSGHMMGKALALDTPLPTPTGWTTMGDVKEGDLLLNEEGQPVRVTACSSVHRRLTYRVRFADGTTIVASDNHRWSVVDAFDRSKKSGRPRRAIKDWRNYWDIAQTHTTKHLSRHLLSSHGQRRWRLPNTRALRTSVKWALPIPPYLLGLWLGDGSTDSAQITCHKDDFPHYELMLPGFSLRQGYDQRFPWIWNFRWTLHPTLDCPKRYLGSKRIPIEALRACRADRLALLRGIMDTDGSVAQKRNARVEIALCNKELADGVAELVTTLGWSTRRSSRPAKIYGRVVNRSYRVSFLPTLNPFSLPRKANRWQAQHNASNKSRGARTQRTIISIEPRGSALVKCVAVDSPRHLYLAGEGMIPTHNTFISSIIAWYFKLCFRPSKVIVSGPGGRNVAFQTVSEIKKRFSTIQAHYTKPELEYLQINNDPTVDSWIQCEDEFIIWFTARKDSATDHATRMAGFHAEHMLFIFDEAGAIDKVIWDGIEGSLMRKGRKLLAIGNPSDPNSEFARFCRRPDVRVIRLNSLEFPNVAQGKIILPYGPDKASIDAYRRKVGEGSARWQFKVLGIFPTYATDTLIPLSMVLEAYKRVPKDCVHAPGTIGLGCDVARGGDDSTVIYALCTCGRVLEVQVRSGEDSRDLMATCGLLLNTATKWGLTPRDSFRIAIDDTGVGGGVTDRARELTWRVRAENFGSGPKYESDEETFKNRRAELWWHGMEWISTHPLQIDDPEIADLLQDELTTPKKRLESDQRIRLEPKDEIKKRIGRSPDHADAFMLAVSALPSGPTQHTRVSEEELRKRDPYWEKDYSAPDPAHGTIVGKKNRDISAELNDW